MLQIDRSRISARADPRLHDDDPLLIPSELLRKLGNTGMFQHTEWVQLRRVSEATVAYLPLVHLPFVSGVELI